ncbi:MAG: hypothetical protein ACXWW7_08025 [Nocardioides sp.]
MAELIIPVRFRGPARSGNGGYTAGCLAEQVPASSPVPTVEVTLRQPPPLDTALQVATGDGVTVLSFDGAPVAEARGVDAALTTVEEVAPDVAASAMALYPGLRSHPFPGCFACGPDREEGDGLQIFPGPVPGHADTVASLWVPHASLAERGDVLDGVERVGVGTTWASLDCVGGWSEDLQGRPMVLGRMTARVDALPVVGEPHVVVGQRRGVDGRKTFTASTLYDSDHRIVATAEHVWIAVDPAAFN